MEPIAPERGVAEVFLRPTELFEQSPVIRLGPAAQKVGNVVRGFEKRTNCGVAAPAPGAGVEDDGPQEK